VKAKKNKDHVWILFTNYCWILCTVD
jgi:hypothetical protein